MNAITDYKKRFFNLLESEMGDVKPLITEQTSNPNESSLIKIFTDIVNCLNADIDSKIKSDPNYPKNKFTFTKNNTKNVNNQNDTMYNIYYGKTIISPRGVLLMYDHTKPNGYKQTAESLRTMFNQQLNTSLPEQLTMKVKNPISIGCVFRTIKNWEASFTPQQTSTQTNQTQQPVKKP
jgi:hypothetical protein